MAVGPTKLSLTRDQLASFLQDHEQIKQFERLFATVDDISNVTLDNINISAGNANASANEALASIEVMKSVLEYLDQAPAAASQEQVAALQEQITALQQMPPPKQSRNPRYGSFYDTTTQTAAAINTAYAMTFNTSDLSYGVTRGTPTSRIYVDTPNVYNVQFSAQVDKTAGGVGLVWVWLRKNGVNVPDSSGQIRIQGNNAEVLAAWNYVIQLNAGDYIELMWEVDDTSVILLAEVASAIHPSVPSVILTVTDNISALEV
jgi:hypothetical protein